MRAGGTDVSLRDVPITQMETGLQSAGDVMHRKRAEDLGDFESCLGRRRLAFAYSPKPGQWPCGGCHACWGVGGRWKSHHRKNVYLSPYVEEPLNSKVIKKSFVPGLRSRQVFFVFRDSYVLCIYVMNIICTFHLLVNGYVSGVAPSSTTRCSNYRKGSLLRSPTLLTFILPMNEILTNTTTPGQIEAGNNGNDELVHITQSSRTGALLSEAV